MQRVTAKPFYPPLSPKCVRMPHKQVPIPLTRVNHQKSRKLDGHSPHHLLEALIIQKEIRTQTRPIQYAKLASDRYWS